MALFDTAEYLALAPWTALIKIVNDQKYLQLEPRQTTLVRFTPKGNQQVEVVLQANRSTSNRNLLPPLGEQTFTFTRLLLGKYFNASEGYTLTEVALPFTTLDLMQRLAPAVVFDVDDFYNETFEQYPTGPITVTAKPESLRWEGSFTLTVRNTLKIDLAVISGTEVPEALPAYTSGRALGYYYLNPFDFSLYRDQLKPLGKFENALDGETLASILTHVTGQAWVCSATPATRNIAKQVVNGEPKYAVMYHGPSMERYTARTDLPTVIILDIDETLCTGLTGAVRLHYT